MKKNGKKGGQMENGKEREKQVGER